MPFEPLNTPRRPTLMEADFSTFHDDDGKLGFTKIKFCSSTHTELFNDLRCFFGSTSCIKINGGICLLNCVYD